MATSGTPGAQQRRTILLEQLTDHGIIRLDASAQGLAVSAMTIRRDLDEMEAEGLLQRIRGGAVAIEGPRPYDARRAVRARAKHIIATKAAALIPRSGAIALDASTTVGTIARSVGPRQGLTIATNSVDSFSVLRVVPGVTAVLTGGESEPKTESLVGLVACQAASSMLYSQFFCSASALDSALGSSEVSLAESQVKQAFASTARETVLCLDSSKLGDRSVALSFTLRDVNVLITELDPQDPQLDEYRQLVDIL